MKIARRAFAVFLVVGVLVIAFGVAFWPRIDPLRASARRAWKDDAVAAIERRVADVRWLDAERERLRRGRGWGDWVGDELLAMRDGSWIVCRSICRKEPAKVHDLFVGRGSDGRWYYSTFHFCVDKCVLRVEPRPASLRSFVDGYFLIPFDGRSDDALRETWHNNPNYGEAQADPATTQP